MNNFLFSSVQFSYSVMTGLQHSRLPCPSPTPKVYSNSCPLSWWCHPTISSSVVPFFSRLQSFPASGSFPMNQFFTSGGIWSFSIGVSASASVLPMNVQDWFPLDQWTTLDQLILQLQMKGEKKSLKSISYWSSLKVIQIAYLWKKLDLQFINKPFHRGNDTLKWFHWENLPNI